MTSRQAQLENVALGVTGVLGIQFIDWIGTPDVGSFARAWIEAVVGEMKKKEDDGELGRIFTAGLSAGSSPVVGKHGIFSTPFSRVWSEISFSCRGLGCRQVLERQAAAVVVAAIYDLFLTSSEERELSEARERKRQ